MQRRTRFPASTVLGSLVVALMVALALDACLGQAGSESSVASSADAPPAAPRCSESSPAAVALLEPRDLGDGDLGDGDLGDGDLSCALALELGPSRALSLLALDDPPRTLARGEAPEACGEQLELCTIDGRVDASLGPLLTLSLRGPESEMPTQVYLGWVAGERMVFVESWYGLPSVIDHTRVGPRWALAPFDCGGTLELRPMARLPSAAGVEPSETLLALSGAWSVDAAGTATPPSAPLSAKAHANCRPALPELP